MNGPDVREIRKRFGLTQEKMAKLLKVTPRTITNYENDGVKRFSTATKIERLVEKLSK